MVRTLNIEYLFFSKIRKLFIRYDPDLINSVKALKLKFIKKNLKIQSLKINFSLRKYKYTENTCLIKNANEI